MAKSSFAIEVDAIQRELKPFLQKAGFKVRGRSFNRESGDGLVHVVSIQMGASDPPGTTYIPGLRENLHGLFAVGLGIYVPEVAQCQGGGEAKSWVQDYHCCVRERLGALVGDGKNLWWHARASFDVIESVREALETDGLPFIDRFATREKILAEWRGHSTSLSLSSPPRIVSAIILAKRGEIESARKLLVAQAQEARNPGHPAYVRRLAASLGLGSLGE